MNWSAVGAAALGFAVMMGAFGAHALRDRLDAYSMGVYEKAVFYHFIHALGVLIVSLMPKALGIGSHAASWVCGLLLAGILIFSGSLYALAMSGARALGAITPLGGLAFIAGWLLLAWMLLTGQRAR